MKRVDRETGALPQSNGKTLFRVWSPQAESVELHILSPSDRLIAMEKDEHGYHEALVETEPRTRYKFRLAEGREFPDPASRFQPEGVHGPSEIVARLGVDTTRSVWDDLDPLEQRIAELPHVASVRVERKLPGTLRVSVA